MDEITKLNRRLSKLEEDNKRLKEISEKKERIKELEKQLEDNPEYKKDSEINKLLQNAKEGVNSLVSGINKGIGKIQEHNRKQTSKFKYD